MQEAETCVRNTHVFLKTHHSKREKVQPNLSKKPRGSVLLFNLKVVQN